MTLYSLCRIDEVPENEIRQFNLKGKEILVINQNMKFHCLEARCTHAGAPLSEGELENGVLQCPWHGSRFKIETGEVVRGPAKKRLPVYASIVKDNLVFVDL
jgi:3-phenylpropionate/trans-cinnamate dioxygenase ferredoxin subunit